MNTRATDIQTLDDLLLKFMVEPPYPMTEPDVAASDATNAQTRIERQGDEYVVMGALKFSS